MANFPERIRGLRLRRGMSQADFAKFLGISIGTLGNWESGANQPAAPTLGKIAKTLEIEVAYLLDDEPEAKKKLTKVEGMSFKVVPLPHETGRPIPVISYASAGAMHDYSDVEGQIQDHVWSDVRDPNAFALIIEGHSMETTYYPGDIVVFAPNAQPRNGDIVVAKIKETWCVQFKRFRRIGVNGQTIRLEAINPEYESFEYPESEFVFIYPAADLKRKLRRDL